MFPAASVNRKLNTKLNQTIEHDDEYKLFKLFKFHVVIARRFIQPNFTVSRPLRDKVISLSD